MKIFSCITFFSFIFSYPMMCNIVGQYFKNRMQILCGFFRRVVSRNIKNLMENLEQILILERENMNNPKMTYSVLL